MHKIELRTKLLDALEKADEFARKIGVVGVAVIALLQEKNSVDWIIETKIVKSIKSNNEVGDNFNFVAIAHAKAAEMMDTLKNSGTSGRELLKGELGWQGGAIKPYKNGYILVAFSGATSDEDLLISEKVIEHFLG